jgi:branched-chain amino acid transport system substrate-binding protein
MTRRRRGRRLEARPSSVQRFAIASDGRGSDAQAAYIKMINDQGGVNGRKINLIQYDDAYSPPKAVEQVRKLVEWDEVLLTFQIIGTPSNAAVQKYLNSKKVPQLFAATGASRFTDRRIFDGRWVSTRTTLSRAASTASTS